jgi:hypothetical protein
LESEVRGATAKINSNRKQRQSCLGEIIFVLVLPEAASAADLNLGRLASVRYFVARTAYRRSFPFSTARTRLLVVSCVSQSDACSHVSGSLPTRVDLSDSPGNIRMTMARI